MRNSRHACRSAICFFLAALAYAKGQTATTVFERSDAQPKEVAMRLEEAVGWKFGYRIPSLLVSRQGTVLAFADRRRVSRETPKGAKLPDQGFPTDVVLKRSFDHGKTWQPEQILFPGKDCNYHSAMAVCDERSGRIYKFARRNPLNTDLKGDEAESGAADLTSKQLRAQGYGDFFIASDDEGKSWSAPQPLDLPYPEDARGCGLCNGVHGIQFAGGRLVILGKYKRVSADGKAGAYTQVFFSDDGGRSWQKGLAAQTADSNLEVVMAKVDEHTVLINHRPFGSKKEADSARNSTLIGADGEALSGSHKGRFYAAVCHAGMTSQASASAPYPLFLTAPSASLTANSKPLPRRNLTLMASRDGGKSWTQQKLLEEGLSAYSDLQFAADGALLCLYEAGEHSKFIKCLRMGGR